MPTIFYRIDPFNRHVDALPLFLLLTVICLLFVLNIICSKKTLGFTSWPYQTTDYNKQWNPLSRYADVNVFIKYFILYFSPFAKNGTQNNINSRYFKKSYNYNCSASTLHKQHKGKWKSFPGVFILGAFSFDC